MNSFQRGIISLIQSAVEEKACTLPEDFSWDNALSLAKKSQTAPLLYYGAAASGLSIPETVRVELESMTIQGIVVDQNQLFAVKQLLDAFEQEGVDAMPLKGTLLKQMYPKTDMRTMSDADILIRTEQYKTICPIMKRLGYTEVCESDHELIWEKPMLHIELHKRLIPSYNKDYYAYYGDSWQHARQTKESEFRYEMSDEDQLIYLFTHFAKHYRDAGIGIRHIVDLWVYRTQKTDLDEAYLQRELTKLQLFEFYQNVMRTAAVWFAHAQEDAVTAAITEKIFGSGSYGSWQSRTLSSALVLSGSKIDASLVRKKRFFSLIFPSYAAMCGSFPVLKKCPVLLPALWAVRWVRGLLFRRKKIQSKTAEMNYLSNDGIRDYKEALNFVGLNFNFENE